MKARHPQLSALQGREVALPGASRGPVPASARARPARRLILRRGRVGRLGSRQNLEMDALDRTQLPSPPVIKLPLARRGPMRFAWALASLSAWSFPALSLGETRSDPSFPWDGTHQTRTRRTPTAPRTSLYLAQKSECLEVGLALPPALIRSASSTTPLQSETISKFPRKTSSATRIAKIAQHGTRSGRAPVETRQPSPTGTRLPRVRTLLSSGKGPWAAWPRRP